MTIGDVMRGSTGQKEASQDKTSATWQKNEGITSKQPW